MNEKIKAHMDQLFETAPVTRKAMDLKEEMTRNASEKYEDLLAEGYSEADAYNHVVSSIGNVEELFEDLREQNRYTMTEEDRRKKACLTSISVGLYIFAGVVFFFLGASGNSLLESFSIAFAGLLCIPPTCMLVYVANMYPNYEKQEDNMVEKYKEDQSSRKRENSIKGAVSTIVWMLVLILYFVISFTTMAWYITWVMFLIGGCAQAIVELVFSIRKEK